MPVIPALVLAWTSGIDGSASPTTMIGRATFLLLSLIALLGLFLLVVVLLTASRRMRNRRATSDAVPTLKDPWQEAGQRVEPFEEGGPVEGDRGVQE